MEREPYIYDVILVMRAKRTITQQGLEANEGYAFTTDDQEQANEEFRKVVDNLNKGRHPEISGCYIRRRGYAGRFQDYVRPGDDKSRSPGLPDINAKA